MSILLIWISLESTPFGRNLFGGILWGYPDLVNKLFVVVGPALVEERKKTGRHTGREEQSGVHMGLMMKNIY